MNKTCLRCKNLTKGKKVSLEDEFYQKKPKEPSKIAQFFAPKPKPVTDPSKIKLPKKPVKLRLLDRAPTSFNLGLTYIMLVGLIFVMIFSDSLFIWILGVPTIYIFYRHIKLEQKRNGVNVESQLPPSKEVGLHLKETNKHVLDLQRLLHTYMDSSFPYLSVLQFLQRLKSWVSLEAF